MNTKLDKILIAEQIKEKNRTLKLFFKDDSKLFENDRQIVANGKADIAKYYNWSN